MRRSLQTGSHTLAALMAALVLVAVLALGLTTLRLDRSSDRLLLQMHTVQTAQQVWTTLLYNDYMRAAFKQTGDPVYQEEVDRTSNQVRSLLADLRASAVRPEDKARLDALTDSVEQYLRTPEPEAGTLEETTGRTLERERELTMGFVDLVISRANDTIAANQRWGQTVTLLGLGILAGVAVLVLLALSSVRRQVIAPLRQVHDAVLHFRPNVPFEPVPEKGAWEICEISRSFNDMAAQLQRQRNVSLSFISGVAHDLRNPLNALALAAAAVRPDRPLPSEEKLRDRFDLVARQVRRLNRQVEDLLDTTRIEAGELSLSLGEHDVVELVGEAVELHREVSETHTLVTDLPATPLIVRCDPARISQVLNNLLSNAIKYSPEGGEVRVTVRERDGDACIEVMDAGIGIPPSERQTIFEPFRRSEQSRHDLPGVGLGLAVSRRIVEAHGGTIEVDSEVGRGSTFRVLLPHVVEDRRELPESSHPMHP